MTTVKATDEGFDPGLYWAQQGDAETATRWRRAFNLFVEGGMNMKEIAAYVGVSYPSLRDKAQESAEDWGAARRALTLVRAENGGQTDALAKIEQQIARVRENREKNLAVAVELRQTLLDVVTKLNAGTLKVCKPFNTKAGPTLIEMPPATSDLVNIANFAKTISELSYRALGDAPPSAEKAGSGASPSTNAPQAGITVILPAVAAVPRTRRKGAKPVVIDVDSTTVANPPSEEAEPSIEPPTA